MYIAGDFNSRIGTLSDVLDQCDVIPIRISLDKSVNKHGHDFIEFLNDAKLCCLNGRICIDNDNFTSVSRKGRYMCLLSVNHLVYCHHNLLLINIPFMAYRVKHHEYPITLF